MEISKWAKTILTVYTLLERIANAIDKMVLTRAANSVFIAGADFSFNNVWSVSNSIINLTQRKVCLINLKLITEQALKLTNKNYARILISNYIDRRKCYETAELLQISLRSYFRKMPLALHNFECSLIKLGYNAEFFQKMLHNENWIMDAKEKISRCGLEKFDKKFSNLIFKDYEKTIKAKSLVNG